ncbi:unnamed protein product [Closterium sp. NIES-54]
MHMQTVAAVPNPGPPSVERCQKTCTSEGLGFESQCMHFGHHNAGGCKKSTGDPRLIIGKDYRLVVLGGYGRIDPLLNKSFYPNGLVVGILTILPTQAAKLVGLIDSPRAAFCPRGLARPPDAALPSSRANFPTSIMPPSPMHPPIPCGMPSLPTHFLSSSLSLKTSLRSIKPFWLHLLGTAQSSTHLLSSSLTVTLSALPNRSSLPLLARPNEPTPHSAPIGSTPHHTPSLPTHLLSSSLTVTLSALPNRSSLPSLLAPMNPRASSSNAAMRPACTGVARGV